MTDKNKNIETSVPGFGAPLLGWLSLVMLTLLAVALGGLKIGSLLGATLIIIVGTMVYFITSLFITIKLNGKLAKVLSGGLVAVLLSIAALLLV